VTPRRREEPQDAAPPPTGSFGDAAGEMANESEVEEPFETPRPSAPQEPPLPGRETAEVTQGVEAGEMVADTSADLGAEEPAGGADPSPLVASYLEQALSERTADLQRLQAEYLNYKRRVERDRELVRENATYAALAPIVDVLDTIDRARDSAESLGSELDEGFSAVAEQLERVVSKAGLVKYGEPGDAFDPRFHEALSHIGEDPEVEVTTCKVVAKAGYRIGDRVVRAAQVLVVDPADS
jgi:molecular chaperone GrpE